LDRKGNGSELPLPLWERVGVGPNRLHR
jgi:hypothetical protein